MHWRPLAERRLTLYQREIQVRVDKATNHRQHDCIWQDHNDRFCRSGTAYMYLTYSVKL